MERILKSLEFNNILLNFENGMTGFIQSLETSLNLTSEQLEKKWKSWEGNREYPFIINKRYIEYHKTIIWIDKEKNKVMIDVDKKHLNNIYLNCNIYGNEERINLNELLTINNLGSILHKDEDKIKCTLGDYDNLKKITLVTFKHGKTEMNLDIYLVGE